MAKYKERFIKARLPHLVGNVSNRPTLIAGITIHSTRSGKNIPDEGERTEGWWNNPQNKVGSGNDAYGSYADQLYFKDGTLIRCTNINDGEYARWTAGYGDGNSWAMGIHYIQMELPQGTVDEPFASAVIDSCAMETARLAHQFKFPIIRLPFIKQTENPIPRGITSHDNCMNGRRLGKSDPGPMFPWDDFIAKAMAYYDGGDDVADPRTDLIVKFLTGQDDPNKLDAIQDWERRDSGIIPGYVDLANRVGRLETAVNQINTMAHGNTNAMKVIQEQLETLIRRVNDVTASPTAAEWAKIKEAVGALERAIPSPITKAAPKG